MKWVLGIAIAFMSVVTYAENPALLSPAEKAKIAELQKIKSPEIKDRTLYIHGKIDSHIYEFLAREYKALKDVDVIELDSLGGNAQWGIDAAKKIASLKKITRLSWGSRCASACVYLFAAGVKREADAGTRLGIHGVRLQAGYAVEFQSACLSEEKSGCKAFLERWYSLARAATDEAFGDMEANGVSTSLRETYYNMPDLSEAEWVEELNVLRKPDWPLNAEDAVQYGLVTEVRTLTLSAEM